MKLIYVVCSDLKEARHIGGLLVSEGIAKCVNILPAMESIYIWKGKKQTSREAILLVKTTREAAAYRLIEKNHSYGTPALFTIKLTRVAKRFANWIREK